MAKKGGTKRKIPMEKIEKKTSRGPCYSKRCKGLFGKASQLCLLSGAQIAVLATPMSDNSHVSFYSFGHSSVDAVVSAFLSGNRPHVPSENNKRMREDIGVCFTRNPLGLGFWCEDETITESQDPKELKDVVDTMSMLLKYVKKLNKGDHLEEPDQTLSSIPDFFRSSDDFLYNNGIQIMSHSEDFYNEDNNDTLPDDIEMDFDQLINFRSDHLVSKELDQTLIPTPEVYCISYDFLQNSYTQIMPNSEDFNITENNNSNNALPDNIEMDFDQLIDFETTSESLLPYHGLTNTSFESLLSNGVYQSTQEPQEFAASPLAISDSHDSVDPSMFSDGDLVLHEFINDSTFSDSEPLEDGDLVLEEFAASLLAGSDSYGSIDPLDSQLVKDGDLMFQNRGFNDDHLHFSDIFSELTTIATL